MKRFTQHKALEASKHEHPKPDKTFVVIPFKRGMSFVRFIAQEKP